MSQSNDKIVFVCLGTRADIIKMCPIINELKRFENVKTYVCLSGQHAELADTVIKDYKITIDNNFSVMKHGQTLEYLLSIMIEKFASEIKRIKPNIVLVHGDTSTALAGAISAQYTETPLAHIEAGLRTYANTPYPEELHRRLITNCASYFLCPDEENKKILISEKINPQNIFVTGNSITDIIYSSLEKDYIFKNERLNTINYENDKEVIVTLHRREIKDSEIVLVCDAIKKLAKKNKNIYFIWPVHPSPRIKNIILKEFSIIHKNLFLLEPLCVRDMHNLIYRASLIITDSGGVQEEAFYLEKPTLVLRDHTERPFCMDSDKCKILPKDEDLEKEILTMLDMASEKTDFSIKKKLSFRTSASKKTASKIVAILEEI